MLCLASFCVVAFTMLALVRMARTIPGPRFPGYNEWLDWWKQGKLPALIFLVCQFFRGGMWTVAGALGIGGSAVIATVCKLIDWPEINHWLIRPTLEFLRWLVERFS